MTHTQQDITSERKKRRKNHAVWLGPVLLLFSVLGIFNRWLGLLFVGIAVVVSLFGVWRAFQRPARWWIRLVALSGLLLAAGCAAQFAPNNFGGDVTSHTIQIDGQLRTYLVHTPPSYDDTPPTPVVLAFHGFMQTGRSFRRLTHLDAVADQEGFLVVYPEGYRRSWNDGDDSKPATRKKVDDVAFIQQMVEQLAQNYTIDRSRVYALGFSNGGFLLVRHACDLSETIAALGIVGAGVYPLWDSSCSSSRPVPATFIVGTEDPMLRPLNERFEVTPAVSGSLWASFNGCDTAPAVTQLPDLSKDGIQVVREAYGGCPENTHVIQYRVEGGGHTWPGGSQYLPRFLIGPTSRDFEASTVLWDFFRPISR